MGKEIVQFSKKEQQELFETILKKLEGLTMWEAKEVINNVLCALKTRSKVQFDETPNWYKSE